MSGCRFNWRFLLGHHYAQYALHSHHVAASLPTMEKVTGALPLPFVIFDGVMVIVATESQCKTLKRYALRLLRVLSRFFDLSNHARVQDFTSCRVSITAENKTAGPVRGPAS